MCVGVVRYNLLRFERTIGCAAHYKHSDGQQHGHDDRH